MKVNILKRFCLWNIDRGSLFFFFFPGVSNFVITCGFLSSLRDSFSPLGLAFWHWGFPGGSDSKESACNAGDPDLIPGSRRSPGKGNGNPLQYSCLENSMDRGVWWATAHGVAKSLTEVRTNTLAHLTVTVPTGKQF